MGAVLASAVILVSGAGSLQGLLAYAAAVMWALIGIVVNQYDASLLTTGAAVVSDVLVALVLFGALRSGRPQRGPDRTVQPKTA